MKKVKLLLGSMLLGLTLSNGAIAALITIDGSLFGSNFDLTYDDSAVGLFGVPTLSNNVVFFTPNEFSAISVDGTGTGFVNSTINLIFTPHDGVQLSSFSLTERGDYFLESPTGYVRNTGQIRVRNVDDALNEGSNFIAPGTPLTTQGQQNWESTAFVDGSTGDWSPSNSAVAFTLENLLIASSREFGDFAFIEKKFAAISVQPVPVPAALPLFFSGLMVLAGLLRRKS